MRNLPRTDAVVRARGDAAGAGPKRVEKERATVEDSILTNASEWPVSKENFRDWYGQPKEENETI